MVWDYHHPWGHEFIEKSMFGIGRNRPLVCSISLVAYTMTMYIYIHEWLILCTKDITMCNLSPVHLPGFDLPIFVVGGPTLWWPLWVMAEAGGNHRRILKPEGPKDYIIAIVSKLQTLGIYDIYIYIHIYICYILFHQQYGIWILYEIWVCRKVNAGNWIGETIRKLETGTFQVGDMWHDLWRFE